MSEVNFISEKDGKPCHEYWLDKLEIPSVSFIIKPCVDYNGISRSVIENARDFGNDVDAACQFYDEDDLDESTLDERVRLRLNGWIKFKKEFDFKPLLIARPMAHVINGMPYGMTPDRYGTGKAGNMLVDIKNTAELEKHVALQLAGYAARFETTELPEFKVQRYAVVLLDDDYRIHEFKDRMDRKVFAALLAVAHWKWARGIRQ